MSLLATLTEMAAKKICPTCGLSMAGNHYWYKGGWRCKSANVAKKLASDEAKNIADQDQPATPEQPGDTVQPTTQPQPTSHVPRTAIDNADSTPVSVNVERLDNVFTILAAYKSELDEQIEKINKVASRVGAEPVRVEVTGERFVDREQELPNGLVQQFKLKMLTIAIHGSAPRLTGPGGSTWKFVGVIMPSASGRAILKLIPGTDETSALRHMHNTDPYYCDYCKTVRRRNETFIVQNGSTYRQVGRNCLSDFTGGVNPTQLGHYFEWFSNLSSTMTQYTDSGSDNEGGGGGRALQFVDPLEVLKLTVAVVEIDGGYRNSKAEHGVPTVASVREAVWPRTQHYSTEEQQWYAKLKVHRNSTKTATTAEAILNWFKSLPEQERHSSSFFQNIDTIISDNAVDTRQLGFLVGLYPAYIKAMNGDSDPTASIPKIREWNKEWGADPHVVENEEATVISSKPIAGRFGTSQRITLHFKSGYVATWWYAGKYDIYEDTIINVTGQFEPDTYFNPAQIKFIPDRSWMRSSLPSQLQSQEDNQ